MKKLFTIITIIFLVSVSKAQDTTSYPKYALSFGIGSNFTLTRFNMDIAAKKIIDDAHQLRVFLAPRISTSNQEEETTESNEGKENTRNRYSIGLGCDYLWILMQNNDFNMFGGSGLAFTFGNEYRETISHNSTGDEYKEELKNPSVSIGIRGILGVEWKVSDKIGIHSEYLFTFSYNRNKQEYNSYNNINEPQTRTVTTSGVSLSSAVLFGLSIYF